jgi:hypothetical protein
MNGEDTILPSKNLNPSTLGADKSIISLMDKMQR